MEYQSSYDGWLEDLPFPIPPGLYGSVLVSPNITEILANAEQFMGFKEYQTAAALFTIALQRLGNPDQFPQKVADLLCKRAECLLLMNYVQNVLRDCQTARRMIGRVTEYVAFLLLRAFEMQGEVEEAFGHAVIYRALDPQMKRDKHAVRRLRQIVGWLCGQGYHQIYRTVDILMLRGEILFSNNETNLALKIYTEVLSLFPNVLEAYEMRAQCYLIEGFLPQANHDCNRALHLSERSSRFAFDTKIKIKVKKDELKEALELLDEWRTIDPENPAIDSIEMNIKSKMQEWQDGRAVSKSQSLSDLSVADNELCGPDEVQTKKRVKRPPIRASKQSSDAKPKSKSELKQEEWRREKERKEIAKELEKQRERANRSKKESVDAIKGEAQPATNQQTVATLAKEPSTTAVLPPLSRRFERTKKRKIRRKTRTLRAHREGGDDDSDASSVCSISTCPGDLDSRSTSKYRPKMPTFSDIDQGFVSDQPKALSRQSQPPKSQMKHLNKQKSEIRPRPCGIYGRYLVCRYIKLKQPCYKGKRCTFAHSEAERKAWEEDRKKGVRRTTVKEEKKTPQAKEGSTLLTEWRQAFKGQYRAPLRMPTQGEKYKLCPDWINGTCKLESKCTDAHGDKELSEWNQHFERMEKEMDHQRKEKNVKNDNTTAKTKTNVFARENLQAPKYEVEKLVSNLSNVTVTCKPEDLSVKLQVPLGVDGEISYSWTVRVCYESHKTGHLQHVTLFPQYHKCYTLSSVKFRCAVISSNGVTSNVQSLHNEKMAEDVHYPVEPYLRALDGNCEVDIVVTFSTLVFGSFSQILVLDFGSKSHLAVKMNVEVGSQEFLQEFGKEKSQLTLNGKLWDDGSRQIVKFEPKPTSVFRNEHLIDKYQLPSAEQIVPSPLLDRSQGLSPRNYTNVMHQLLFVEELYIRKQIASFNIQGATLHTAKLVVKKYEVLCAQEGWLYGTFEMRRQITPDDAQGRLLLRNLFSSMGSVLIAKSDTDSVVYEALLDSVEDNRVILKLSEKCCKDLELSNNTFMTVDVQFHINRLPLCEMHDNIDRLGPEHLRILFPELGVYSNKKIQQLRWILHSNLNEDQREIINKIAAPAIDSPPLVVFGPFGTGKTFTLNQAIRRISVDQNSRVLLCTHSNSAADLHVELLDTYLKKEKGIAACKPLRIYTPLRKLSTVPDVVKEYCLIADKGEPTEAFRLPTREEVIKHRVIVSTLSMSRALFDMDLHRYFSHILIDEAAQALETEMLTPLTLAGNNTKVVFTGDHMQMSPDVFSPQAKMWRFQISLQERLFYDYKQRLKEPTLDPNLILLTENYRSNERVLKFSSDMFYGGQLTSGSKQPLHPKLGPLAFYAALGKEEIDDSNSSFRNLAEVNEVVKRVKELSDCWPEEEWRNKDLTQIAVISSYRYQVKTIRDALRKVGLGSVDVETIDNVQGKQFRALFVSTVRTSHTSKTSSDIEGNEVGSPYLYFLSDPKLLNTALTRAQSLIAVVGDPFSLRTVGKCQGLWEDFIKRCSDDGKLFGIEHDELEDSISQTGLNVNAAEFVPTAVTTVTTTNQQLATDPGDSLSEESLQENNFDVQLKSEDSTFSAEKTCSSVKYDSHDDTKHCISDEILPEEEECESTSEGNDAGDEMSENDDLGNADDFAEFNNVDDTVPPINRDPIIQALKKKCEDKVLQQRLKGEERNGQNKKDGRDLSVDSEQDKEKMMNYHHENDNHADKKISGSKIVHEDIKMKTKKGKTQIFLVNFNHRYSERTERLISQPEVHYQERLEPEYLDRLLRDDPNLYRECTLKVSNEGVRSMHGELRDVDSEDILIERNTRQCFDRDRVVVKLSEKVFDDNDKKQGSSTEIRGTVCGVRHHAINLRERQFVCTISRENPRLMFPINKSMTPIANLTDVSIRGVPIYKRVQSGEKAVRVETLSFQEAFSGKYLFVVQYLQWRREFPFPLGAVTKKFPKGNDRVDAFKLLNAEYQLKEDFPIEVIKEVERESQINRWDTVPLCERQSRQMVVNAFTIDPQGSRALDDALTIEELTSNLYKVGVHIADVSFFVRQGCKIDQEAKKRASSYFRGHGHGEVPMLPAELSHNICSLLPNKERRAVSVYMIMDKDGRIHEEERLDFSRNIVKSQCRLTYSQAQQVILGNSICCSFEDGQITSQIAESVRLLSSLAQKRRKQRLGDGSYFHFDHPDRNEDLEAHELVEEMMILANTLVARYLVLKTKLVPLRIQLPPKTHKFDEWRGKFGNCARLSVSLSRHLSASQDSENVESILVPKSTWNSIASALRQCDYRKVKLSICNDNVFPQLAIANSSLNKLRRKAEDVTTAEVEEEYRMHWSLNVREYTRFTSPIRRYFDIVVHRLLLETVGQEAMEDDLKGVYRRCSLLSDMSSKFEKECGRVQLAEELRLANCEFSAIVETIERDFITLHLVSDANQFLSPKQRKLMISHLGPVAQPNLDESSKTLQLKWKLRIYEASTENIDWAKQLISSKERDDHLCQDTQELVEFLSLNLECTSSGYRVPGNLWLKVLNAVKDGDENRLSDRLREIDELIAREREERKRMSVKGFLNTKARKECIKDETESNHDDDNDDDDDDKEEEDKIGDANGNRDDDYDDDNKDSEENDVDGYTENGDDDDDDDDDDDEEDKIGDAYLNDGEEEDDDDDTDNGDHDNEDDDADEYKICDANLNDGGDDDDDDDVDDDDNNDDDDDDDDDDDSSSQEENDNNEMDSEENTKKKDAMDKNSKHFVEISLELQVADTVSIQLSANNAGAMISPEIQCLKLSPNVEICIEHRKFPDKCFSVIASGEACRQRYKTIRGYVNAWRPVVSMEAATVSVKNDDTFILQNLKVKWRRVPKGKFVGEFQLDEKYCKTRHIEIFTGDYACVRVSCPGYYSRKELALSSENDSEYETASDGEGYKENVSLAGIRANKKSCWVAHCNLKVVNDNDNDDKGNNNEIDKGKKTKKKTDAMDSKDCAEKSSKKYVLKLFQHSMDFSDVLKQEKNMICTVEIIKRTIPFSRMISTLIQLQQNTTDLLSKICLGRASRMDDLHTKLPSERLSIAEHKRKCKFKPLNDHQERAVRKSLRGRFTLIQGPPGTGKTVVGVHIAYWFAQVNLMPSCPDECRQVLYCGPSNKAVDVVAEYLKRIKGIDVLRIYGNVIEEEEFPIPTKVKQIRKTTIHQVPDNLKYISLHHVIRDENRSPKAAELKGFEEGFALKKEAGEEVDDETVEAYLKAIKEAERMIIGSVRGIVLCTCSVAGSNRVRKACNIFQCIIDECAMCLEPETLVPIHCSEANQVVLIGDHMQLQPIVTNRVAKSFGLNKSLFERYSNCAFMLEEQYRMHEDICEFPSRHFYESRLKTANPVKERERKAREEDSGDFLNFWPSHSETTYVPLVFCNVVGEEEELVVTSEEGHERSKSNVKEKDKVVEVIMKLLACGVKKKSKILVLSPYRAQCHIIQQELTAKKISGVSVTSIVKSQGSEKDFVIISLVRSLPDSQIDHEPSGGWLRERLGFVTDEHQINVALTRAKRGLCIIGNKNLLEVCEMWGYLIEHYRKKKCLVDGEHWPETDS